MAEAILVWFGRKGRFAVTNPGLRHTARDTRIPDVGVFLTEPEWDVAYHDPSEGQKRDAAIKRFRLAVADGDPVYRLDETTTLARLTDV